MWETVFPITYQDFEVDESDKIYHESLKDTFEKDFQNNNSLILRDQISGEIPGTDQQQKSSLWLHERMFRITASKCKTVTLLGEKLSPNDSKVALYNWIYNNIWFHEHITTLDMQYGIDNEINGLIKYSEIKGVPVVSSGLWIHGSFCHLGASPDGLIYNEQTKKLQGIVEIKCLKIFKERTVADTIKLCENGDLKSVMARQCFVVKDGKIFLKKSHMYYFQIQLQLLITQADYCDFVLYSALGDPNIERINHDKELQNRIISSTKAFWSKVLIPEYFLMRVPRKLHPVIL